MRLPRWTVYPSLFLIATFLAMAIPRTNSVDPNRGAAAASMSTTPARAFPSFEHAPLVVLGIDGMDPDILAEVIAKYPEDMPNFRWLVEQGDGIQSLRTSVPPQSPVAWSNFITGLDPGGHGIFDFIHRDPVTRAPLGSSNAAETKHTVPLFGAQIGLPGQWKMPNEEPIPNRTGKPFWALLKEKGIPSDIWRMPANIPVEPSKGLSFPGMLTPAVDSDYGECSFLTTDPLAPALDYKKARLVTEYNGRIDSKIDGPKNFFKDGDPVESVPLSILIDYENEAVVIDTGMDKVVMQAGQWSDFVELEFKLLPLGAMNMSGICRFYLRSIQPELELYVSPVNFDPLNPATTVSEPEDACTDLAEAIGRYYTQGMAEDVNALKEGVLSDSEFMQQVELVYLERREMMDYALDHYLEEGEGGLLFFYYSTVDLACHMMWRHFDRSHPAHEESIAGEDSSQWSGRDESTWKDTVHDLYRKMDPVLGRIRERLGDDVPLVVMSDHGFASYRRKFSLNTWLYENGYLVLEEGQDKELPKGDAGYKKVMIFIDGVVDWSRTRAYGMGFNGLYLNLKGRELDNPDTEEDESGIVDPSEAEALLAEIKEKLEALEDPETGVKPILRCDLTNEVYHGERVSEAPDMQVGYNAGYGNSDPASLGQIPHHVLEDNTGGTFNGSHLMSPDVVSGILLSTERLRDGEYKLEDLTVEILRYYGVKKTSDMRGSPVFNK